MKDLDSRRLKLISDNSIKLFGGGSACWYKYVGVIFFTNLNQFLNVLLWLLDSVRNSVEFSDIFTEPAA